MPIDLPNCSWSMNQLDWYGNMIGAPAWATEVSDNGISRGTYGCGLEFFGNFYLSRWLHSSHPFNDSNTLSIFFYSFMWWSTRPFLKSCGVYFCHRVWGIWRRPMEMELPGFLFVDLAWATTYEPSENHSLQMRISSSCDRGILCGLVLDTM